MITKQRMTPRLRYVAAALMWLPFVGACESEAHLPTAESTGREVDRDALTSLYEGAEFRYAVVDETEDILEEFADLTEIALTGEVIGYEPGPDFTPAVPGGSGRTVIMLVHPTDVFLGAATEERVQVLLHAPLGTVTDYAAALPTGSPVALYLTPAVDLPPEQAADRYIPVSPQGFVTEDDVGVIFPMDSELNSPESLQEQLPDDVDAP